MRIADVVRVGVLGVIYVATAKVGLSLDAVHGFAAAVWPPTGLALAALVLYGVRLWPGIAVGAFLVNWSAGAPVPVACGMALGNTLEALVGAVLLTRVVGLRPALDRLRDVLGVIVLAAGISTLVSATLGVTSGWLGGLIPPHQYGKAWRTWWLGDAMGALVVAPLLFVWSRRGRSTLPWRGLTEVLGLLGAVGALSYAVFGPLFNLTLINFTYLIFPPLIWAAVRLGPRGAATATALVLAIAIWGTVQGFGPFAEPTLHEGLFMLQGFMSVVAATILVLGAVTAERQQAEEARIRLAAIVESSEDAIIGKTLEGIITSWNQGAERIYGYRAEDVIGRSLALLVPSDRPDELPGILARLARGEAISHYETERMRQDGQVIPVSLTISPVRNPGGTIVGAATIARDITARRQAEAEVERRRQEAELLAEIAQGLSASLDLDTVLQRVVTGAQELCGSERVFLALREPGSDILVGRYEVGAPQMAYTGLRIGADQGLGGQVLRTGRTWRTADYAADTRFSKEYMAGARAAGHLAVLAVPILIEARVEGVLYTSNHATRPFTDRDEEILERLAVHAALAIQNAQLYRQVQAELADRQKAEAALAQAAAELEQRVEERTTALRRAMAERQHLEEAARRAEHFALLGRLAAGVSHEIRNPLAVVFLHVDLLEEELRTASADSLPIVAEALAEIKTNLARLEDLVQDYLTLVRMTGIQREIQDLGEAVQDWGTEMQHEVEAQGVTVQMHGLEGLGPVAFHASTLRRALLNLVQNAADAMPQGGTVTLTGHGTATQVQLCVQDMGSGIPAEHLGQIFEPLYTTKPGGTGLGLYIVQEIVAAHDGQITVESMEGKGTTFILTLPRTTRTAPPPEGECP